MKLALKSLLVVAFLGASLSACGNSTTENTVAATTVGDELAALEKAYADGLLSEKEYKDQREKILDRK
ncbi:hypothetical protein [Shimia abyssi]|uniref:Oligomerization/nucleic acid binding protein n=1 Tax=Shimia abyssi TaxID=1662395 RepID=A0A2P8FER6_9RHOB|nr:hypothetical protein [Shimia abyssi]PSL20184.1 hypothetical protein CLV88_104245 [Shimia abyssi]